MNNQKLVGIDMGATKIHLGLVQGTAVIDELRFPTPQHVPAEQLIAEIIKGIEQLTGSDFTAIGIGVPGLVDEERGIVYDLTNIPSWQEVFLKKQLEGHFNKAVYITNDANTFVLGEKTYGKGKAFKNIVGITLGSGFGSGIIIDHKLYSGTLSGAGEMADIPYLTGTIEDYCSGKFFRREFGMDGHEVFALACKGDANALEIYKQFGAHLGNAIKLILHVLSPEAVLLGGSVSAAYAFFKDALHERIASFPFKRVSSQLFIAPSETANIAILGAVAIVKMRQPALKAGAALP